MKITNNYNIAITNREIISKGRNELKIDKGNHFKDILDIKIEERKVKFSKHANLRIKSRDIKLTKEQLKRLDDGVDKAREKGIRDSVILIDNIVLVVNIKNNKVITAVNNDERVFTNIDGAVIV